MAIPPQLLMQIAQIANNKKDKAKAKLESDLQEIPGVASGLGSILQQTALSEDGQANVGQSAIGGLLQGGAAGAALGPLGIIGGALLGGASGLGSAAQSNADFYDNKALKESFQLSSKTVAPSIFGPGGMITGSDELVPVQLELDETYVNSDLEILKSKADEVHEDMDDLEITDVVKDNSFAFSNRKHFTPGDFAKDVLGYGFAHYSEDGNYDLDKVLMSDVFGDSNSEISFSKAADMIAKKYKTVRSDDKDVDLLTRITNDENKQARLPFVNRLIQIHEQGSLNEPDFIVPQKFGKGGKIKKYEKGGDINSIYDELFSELEMLDQDNNTDFQTTNEDTANLFGRMNTRNSMSSILNGLAVGTQSTTVDPALMDSRFADEMFEEMSPVLADQITNQGNAQASSLIANIARTSPQAAQQVAPRLFDSALQRSNQSRLSIIQNNLAQRRGKYSFLNRNGNFNRRERVRAEMATRNLVNKKRQALANVGTEFLTNRNTLDSNKFTLDREAQGQFNENRMSIFQNKLNAVGNRGSFDAQMAYIGQRNEGIKRSAEDGAYRSVTPIPSLKHNPKSLRPRSFDPSGSRYLPGGEIDYGIDPETGLPLF